MLSPLQVLPRVRQEQQAVEGRTLLEHVSRLLVFARFLNTGLLLDVYLATSQGER